MQSLASFIRDTRRLGRLHGRTSGSAAARPRGTRPLSRSDVHPMMTTLPLRKARDTTWEDAEVAMTELSALHQSSIDYTEPVLSSSVQSGPQHCLGSHTLRLSNFRRWRSLQSPLRSLQVLQRCRVCPKVPRSHLAEGKVQNSERWMEASCWEDRYGIRNGVSCYSLTDLLTFDSRNTSRQKSYRRQSAHRPCPPEWKHELAFQSQEVATRRRAVSARQAAEIV